MRNKFNIPIGDIYLLLDNKNNNIRKNCIYVTQSLDRIRYINHAMFGIELFRDYKINL
jgi:hypothetical protein